MAYDVVVVGGGVVGCACALALAGRGLGVAVLERAGLAADASGRNGGLLLPHPEPAAGLLYREGVAGYRRLAEEGRIPFGLRPTALLVVAADDAGLAEAKRHAVVGASLAASLREDAEQPETARGLARRVLRFVPGLAGVPVVASWSGVRPVTPDGHPLIGPVPGLAGLWVAAGHGPIGVMAAPATARMLAGHLADGHPDPDAGPFDPARFSAPAVPTGPADGPRGTLG